MNIFVYGDIGGHLHPFRESLAQDVGMDGTKVPDGKVVIQVGDLVHRGPDSDELVAWVDEVMHLDKASPGPSRWIQLFGNHEGHHIGGPIFGQMVGGKYLEFGVAEETEAVLKRWWASKQAHMAAVVEREDGRQVLITHAGLMRHTWDVLGEPSNAVDAARALNRQDLDRSFAGGYLLGSQYSLTEAGSIIPPSVAWASASHEVYPSWENKDSLFDQIHGHSGIYNWYNRKWFVDYSIQHRTVLKPDERFSRWTNFDGHTFICVDQALGVDAPSFDVKPFFMRGEVLIP